MSVFITGMGAISAIGNSSGEHFTALNEMQHGIRKIALPGMDKEILAAQVPFSDQELAKRCKNTPPLCSRTSLLGILAAEECWGKKQLIPELRTGIISGTSVGGMDITENAYRTFLENGSTDFEKFLLHDSGKTTETIAEYLGITDHVNTISTACSSASNAIMQGARLLQAGILDRVLVGGTDALTQFTISGFSSLMIYNQDLCKPFDEQRNGLNLGEGAGFLLLENERSLIISGSKPLATLLGWGNAADAHHQTASSPQGEGAALAISKALKKARLKPEDIDYINAHGTGTKNNDLSESMALQTIFGEQIPPYASTKSYTGHTLAASGGLEAVFCVLSLQHHTLFPTLRFTQKMSETPTQPLAEIFIDTDLKYILSNSFGFGGNCTSLIMGKE